MKQDLVKFGKIGLVALFIIMAIMIKPIHSEQSHSYITTIQSSSPIQNGNFGSDIALSDDRLVVGETGAQVDDINGAGRAYLFDTDWNRIATLTPNTPKTLAKFSRSLDIKGDLLAVCNYRINVEGVVEAGEVQVYDTMGTLLYTLQSTQPTLKCKFGRELAIGNDVLIIGHCVDYECKGTVAVFDLEQNYLTTLSSEAMTEISAGDELAANDEFIFIGPYGQTLEIDRVFVYDYDWNHLKTLQPPEPDTNTDFGECISVSGDHFVVGEPRAAVNEHRRAGRAHIYDTNWNILATLQSPSPDTDAEFGTDVSIAGGFVVVGEAKGDVTGGDEGKVYVFDLSGNLLDTIVSPEPETGAQFGFNVVTDGDILVVSEVDATVDEFTGAGKVHVYQLGEYPVEEITTVVEELPETEETDTRIPGFAVIALFGGIFIVIFLTRRNQ